MFDLIAILIPIVLAICIVVTIRIIEDARLRRHIVDAGADEALVKVVLGSELDTGRRASFKWGIVLVLIGAAFAAMAVFGLDAEDPQSYALLFVAAGVGMLVYRVLDAPAR
jgi:hypothetical protein